MNNRWFLAILAIWLFGCAWLTPGFAPGQQSPSQNVPWPRTVAIDGAKVVVYQPQAVEWPNQERLTTRTAVSISRPGDRTPVLGTVEVSFATRTDAATGDVILSDPRLVASQFPTLNTEQAAELENQLKKALPEIQPRNLPKQTVLLTLKEATRSRSTELQNKPPVIFYSDKPASLVVFDGEPVLAPVGKTGLSFAVNTNWDIFTDGKAWYLMDDGLWLKAPGYAGPYEPVSSLPSTFNSIPADKNFAAVRKAIPPKIDRLAAVPKIFVSTKPADIIVTEGAPQFVPIPGTGLQAVKNTSSTLYFEPATGQYFLLISGRWYSARGFNGPWTFATDDLPHDFALIPPYSPEARVLPSVPGTSEAQLAVLRAEIPYTAAVPKDVDPPVVVYSGPPQFKPIPGTVLRYAVNTPFEVIETGGKYYVCYEGAWFVGPTPTGPWVLAETVPEVIYTIPPSCPLYNVTYVYPYWVTPTAIIFGYTAGYMMGFVTAGVCVYGTGYYYPPVVIVEPVPVYYPYPCTYVGDIYYNPENGAWVRGGTFYGPYGGMGKGGIYYNPATGAWTSGGSIYGPYGGTGAFSYYNPTTGRYAHGYAAWNPDGGSAVAGYTNPRTGISASTSQTWNPYSRSGSSTITGPSQTVHTESGRNSRGAAAAFSSSSGAKGAGYLGAEGDRGAAVKTQGGNVYAGHDGNVYRRTPSGWSKWINGSWQPLTPPASSYSNPFQSPQFTSPSTSTIRQGIGGAQRSERFQPGSFTTQGNARPSVGGYTLPQPRVEMPAPVISSPPAVGSPQFIQRGFSPGGRFSR